MKGSELETALNRLQHALRYTFRDPALLRVALTHPSVAHERATATLHNQRLEFLGDAVLQLVLTRELYEKFPDAGEGLLTKARAHMVNRRALAEQARLLNLGGCLVLSRGEEISGGRQRPSILADAFEALVGAMFMDGGYAAASEFLLRVFRETFGTLDVLPNLENPKGELQEILQARSPEPPQYILRSVTGPDHDREFECTVHLRGTELGRGIGKSKKAAESQAALAALRAMRAAGPAPEPDGLVSAPTG
jgi:ribonuclease-3